MQLSLKLGLGTERSRHAAKFNVFDALGTRNGFAIDFIHSRMVVNDATNSANVFDGDPRLKLTTYGADNWDVDTTKGLNLDAARDFAVAIAKSVFPFNSGAVHVYAKYTLNSADSADQRYLFMIDNTGDQRFAMYTTSGAGFRMVTGDGVSADTEVSSMPLAANTEYRTVFGADSHGRSWVDAGGVQTDDALHQLSANTVDTHIGLGGYPDRVLRALDGHLAEVLVICEDVLRERRLTLEPLAPFFAAEGDSHTFNVSFGMPDTQFYPHIIGQAEGVVARNFGSSGDSSAKMLAEVADVFAEDVPSIATIYAGSNDTETNVMAVPAPSNIAFSVENAAKLAVGGWVLVNGESAKIAALTGDAVVLDAPLSVTPAAGDVLAVDTVTNLRLWVQAVKAKGVARVAIIGSHYLNFVSGGDTTLTEQNLRAGIRVAQRAAASAENVQYVDTYTYMRDRILAEDLTQGDWSAWHQGATNTHLTPAGEQVLADAIRAAIF